MSDLALNISLTVNGEPVAARVEARKTLVDFLREDLALQLHFVLGSESIGPHDSGGHGWSEHRLRRRLGFGRPRCGM
jgi:hypothetical protein